MVNIQKQSIKIELDPADFGRNKGELLEETFYEAVDRIIEESGEDEEEIDFLLSKFFTLRFDETQDGGVAATLTSSEKRG